MRTHRNIPETDFVKFGKEVLDKGAVAALPKNLPDRWLKPLTRDIVNGQIAALSGRGEKFYACAPWLFIVAITMLSYKKGGSPQEHSHDEVVSEMQKYKDALISELIARQVGVQLIQYDFSSAGSHLK